MSERFACVWHPGVFLLQEMDARDWRVSELAERIGVSRDEVVDVIVGDAGVSDELAEQIGRALGTSAAMWRNLNAAWLAARPAGAPSREDE